MSKTKNSVSFESTTDLAKKLGFTSAEAELITMKGSVIGLLDKERERRGLNHREFADSLEIPRSRWSSILSQPQKVTLDYLLMLAAKCGAHFKLTKKAA